MLVRQTGANPILSVWSCRSERWRGQKKWVLQKHLLSLTFVFGLFHSWFHSRADYEHVSHKLCRVRRKKLEFLCSRSYFLLHLQIRMLYWPTVWSFSVSLPRPPHRRERVGWGETAQTLGHQEGKDFKQFFVRSLFSCSPIFWFNSAINSCTFSFSGKLQHNI